MRNAPPAGDILAPPGAYRSAGVGETYRADRPCKRGHEPIRYVRGGTCVECQAAHRAANREKARLLTAKWRAENPDQVRANNLAWKEKNKDRKVIIDARNSVKNAAHKRAVEAAWRDMNRAHVRAVARAWRAKNPTYNRAHKLRRRALAALAGGRHSRVDLLRIYQQQRGRCSGCRVQLHGKYDVDHIIPLARGGTNFAKNLQIMCAPCNRSKGAKDHAEWARVRLGRLL